MNSVSTHRPCLSKLNTLAIANDSQRDHACDLFFESVDERFVWIMDAGQHIGLIDRQGATLEWIAPHTGLQPPKPAEVTQNYHAPAFQGGRVVLQWWLDDGAGLRVDAQQPLTKPSGVLATHPRSRRPVTEITLGSERGTQLSLAAHHRFEGDERIVGSHRVTIRYDQTAMSYSADVEAELVAPDPYHAEFCNLYAGGVYDNRAELKRYVATAWEHPDGKLLRWNHNPVSYLSPGMNDRTGKRRIAQGGFIGYFTDESSNPIVQVTHASPPATSATCSNLYDEHLTCLLPEPTDEGNYHWQVSFRFYSLPHSVAESILRDAELIDLDIDPDCDDPVLHDTAYDDSILGRRFLRNPRFPGFILGKINDFEAPIDLASTVVGSMIWASASPQNQVYWDPNVGHTGNRSIRLRGNNECETTRTRLAGGPTPHLDGGRTYRLSGWVRCHGVEGAGASFRFDVIGRHTSQSPLFINRTPLVRGDCDWTHVETTFQTAPDAELGWLYLELEGPGEAWFDELILEPC